MTERIISGFNSGYVKAITDIRNYFADHSDAITSNRLWNKKGVLGIIDALAENYSILRDTGTAELICDKNKKIRISGRI